MRRLLVRLPHDIVDLTLLVRGAANHYRSRDVRAVALDLGAEVQEQQVALAHAGRCCPGVWERRPRAAGHDRRERKALTAFIAQRALEHPGNLELGHPDTHL